MVKITFERTLRRRFDILGFEVVHFRAEQDAIGTWTTPLGRVWQWRHHRFVVRRK